MHHAEVAVIADSVSEAGIRITTFQLRYWRPIHSELMTHRKFSRSAGSSRARPSAAIIEQVADDPWGPLHWGKNQKGMQAFEELGAQAIKNAQHHWRFAARQAAVEAEHMLDLGLHKQVVNRILEPFTYIDVVVTATEYNNWFRLRDDDAADPTIRDLAKRMRIARDESIPHMLKEGEWHLPYILTEDWEKAYQFAKVGRIIRSEPTHDEIISILLKVSTARCARVSYKAFDGSVAPFADDVALYEKLLVSEPLHASPAEHQATPDVRDEHGNWTNQKEHGNFTGFRQHRKMIPYEYIPG